MRPRLVMAAMLLALLPELPPRAAAQTSSNSVEPDVPEKAGKNLRGLRAGDTGAPRVDGRLDDHLWVRADRIDDFVQVEPNNMAPPTERTTVQVAYDSRYLYIGGAVRNEGREHNQIWSGASRQHS